MKVNITRAKIEGANALGIIPKTFTPLVEALLEKLPNVDGLSLEVKAMGKDGKEIEIDSHLKTMFMSSLLGLLTSSKK